MVIFHSFLLVHQRVDHSINQAFFFGGWGPFTSMFTSSQTGVKLKKKLAPSGRYVVLPVLATLILSLPSTSIDSSGLVVTIDSSFYPLGIRRAGKSAVEFDDFPSKKPPFRMDFQLLCLIAGGNLMLTFKPPMGLTSAW